MTFRERVRAIGLPWWMYLVIGVIPAIQSRRLIDPVPGSNDVVWGVTAAICAALSIAAAMVAYSERRRAPERTDDR
jgi:hypothetical protein